MTCPEFESRLSSYLDGELSRWRRWKVETHVRYCSDCAEMLRDLEEVDGALMTSAQEAATPDYLTQAVMHRLPAMPPAHEARRSWLRRPAGAAVALAVAGAQLVALGGAYWWGFLHGRDRLPTAAVIGSTVTDGGSARIAPRPSVTTPTGAGGNGTDRSSRPSFGPGGIWTKQDPRYVMPDAAANGNAPTNPPAERRPLRLPFSAPLSLPVPASR